jgi:hypothetical protein
MSQQPYSANKRSIILQLIVFRVQAFRGVIDMQLYLARVVLENTEAANEEIKIDLVLEGKNTKPGLDYFGVWQDKQTSVRCPFVMDPNGRADFGTGYDGADRYYESNILSLALAIGLQVGWRDANGEATYRVTGITQLI